MSVFVLFCFCTKCLTPDVYSTLRTYLSSDSPHFQCSTVTHAWGLLDWVSSRHHNWASLIPQMAQASPQVSLLGETLAHSILLLEYIQLDSFNSPAYRRPGD